MTHSTVTIESLTKLANDLMAQNAGLKNKIDVLEAKINNGIRVYVEYYEDEMFINETAVGKEMRNATLLLDEGWDK